MALKKTLINLSVLSVAMGITTLAHASRPCPPDINCSGAVNVDDLLAIINNWGPVSPGNPSDVNQSGMVNVDDLLAVINAWGPCVFNFGGQFPNAEAQQIGLEMLGPGGPLTLVPTTYERIVRDLGLIRTAYPALANQTHSQAWVPNRLLISITNPQSMNYLCHNTYYQVTSIQPLFSTWYTVNFAGKINVPALGAIYAANAGVMNAEPDALIGGQNFWVPTNLGGGMWRWNIDDGFTDCTDGCDCHYYYVINVDSPGNVTLVSFTQQGQPWCKFTDR